MKRIPQILACFLLVFGMARCASVDISGNDPAKIYEEAEQDIKNDKLLTAVDRLKLVKNKFPYSHYAVDAQLRLADVYFLQESYAEAAASYEVFRDLHPKHPRTPYAMYRVAKSHYMDAPSNNARDLTSAQHAVDAYNDFLKRFPDAEESAEARKDLTECREKLAAKELYIADFYFKDDFHGSARARYEKVIALYPDTKAGREALEKLPKVPPAPAP